MNTIIIPTEITQEFLGTIALDILHDCRDCYIPDGKLKQLTDIISYGFYDRKQLTITEFKHLKTWIFKEVLHYFCTIWKQNLKALSLHDIDYPNFDKSHQDVSYWMYYFEKIKMPIRSICNDKKTTMSTELIQTNPMFYSSAVNTNWEHIYNSQSTQEHFSSPSKQRHTYEQFTNYLQSYYDTIYKFFELDKHQQHALVSLDQKGAAGLLRVITEPFGYVTGLPTFTDCGYNMIGMSGLRKESHLQLDPFQYSIIVQTCLGELELFNSKYDVHNDIPVININKHEFTKKLPSSKHLGTSLSLYSGYYITPPDELTTWKELFTLYSDHVIYYVKQSPHYAQTDTWMDKLSIHEWISTVIYVCELLAYQQSVDMSLVASIHKQYVTLLFLQTQGHLICKKPIKEYLKDIKINRKSAYSILLNSLTQHKQNIHTHIQKWIDNNIHRVLRYIKTIGSQALRNPFSKSFLKQWKHLIKQEWREHELIPHEYIATLHEFKYNHREPNELLYFAYLLKIITDSHSFVKLKSISLDDKIYVSNTDYIYTRNRMLSSYSLEHKYLNNAYKHVIGKLQGDFGQIIWSMVNNKIFATEDTNTAAMSLILSKSLYPRQHWMTIYGKGDGASVFIVPHSN